MRRGTILNLTAGWIAALALGILAGGYIRDAYDDEPTPVATTTTTTIESEVVTIQDVPFLLRSGTPDEELMRCDLEMQGTRVVSGTCDEVEP